MIVMGAVACYGGVAPLPVLTNATNNDANPTDTFTGFGTIGGIATALCTNLNSWVASNNANASYNRTSYRHLDFLYLIKDKQTKFFVETIQHHNLAERCVRFVAMLFLWHLQ